MDIQRVSDAKSYQSQLEMSVCRFVDVYAGEKAKLPDAAMVRRAGRYNDVLPA